MSGAPRGFVDLDGTRRRRGDGGEIVGAARRVRARRLPARPRRGANRYVMTRTENLAPLLDLPTDARSSSTATLRSGTPAPSRRSGSCSRPRPSSESCLRQRARPASGRGARSVEGRRRAADGGLECSRASALAPDGSPVDGFAFDGALTVTLRRRRAGRRRHPRRARAAADRRSAVARAGRLLRREPAARLHARSTRASRRAASTSRGWSRTRGRSAPTAARRPAVFARGGGLVTSEREPARAVRRRLRVPRRAPADLARLPLPRGAAPLRRLRDAAPPDVQTLPLAARRARRARVRAERRRLAARAAAGARRRSRTAAWVSVEEAAELAAWGLYRWHYRADPPRLIETARVRPRRVGDAATATHARLVGQRRPVRVRAAAPRPPRRQRRLRRARPRRCSTTSRRTSRPAARSGRSGRATAAGRGAGTPTTTRAHARTLADAALFMLRAGGTLGTAAARVERRRRAAHAARRRRAAGRAPRRDRRRRLVGGHAPACRGSRALVEAGHVDEARARRRVLRAVRHVVRRAGGRRPRADAPRTATPRSWRSSRSRTGRPRAARPTGC